MPPENREPDPRKESAGALFCKYHPENLSIVLHERQFFFTRARLDCPFQFEGLGPAAARFACQQDNRPSSTRVPGSAGKSAVVFGQASRRVFGYAAIQRAVRTLHEVYMPNAAFH